ncbi:unnamed protein product, partial [Owenia fusiformis]
PNCSSYKSLTDLTNTLPPYTGLPDVADPYVIDPVLIQNANSQCHSYPKLLIYMVACQMFTLGEIRGRNYLGKSSKTNLAKGKISIPKKNALEASVAVHFPSLKKKEISRLSREVVNRRIRYIFTERLDTFPWFMLH